jgi:hypothetical protein
MVMIYWSKLFLLLIFYSSLDVSVSAAQSKDYFVSEVAILNNSATMHKTKNRWITFVTGSVGKKGIPNRIRLGDQITVKNTTITINHIRLTVYSENMRMPQGYKSKKKGDMSCVLVESKSDIPDERERARIWINATACRPVR